MNNSGINHYDFMFIICRITIKELTTVVIYIHRFAKYIFVLIDESKKRSLIDQLVWVVLFKCYLTTIK